MTESSELAQPPGTVRVVVTVGTDVHPFHRAVAWIDEWAQARGLADDVVIQYGTSNAPTVVRGSAYLDHAELVRLVGGADAVVTHGGPATIMEVRERHGTPIVLPRDPSLGEHVDRHQMEFAAVMARLEAAYAVRDDVTVDHLDGMTVQHADWAFNVRPSNTEPLLRLNLEAKSKALMEEKRDQVVEIIRS